MILKNRLIPRVAPFALFMAFIGLEELLRFSATRGFFPLSATAILYLYPLKAFSVGILLLMFRSNFQEIRLRDLQKYGNTAISIIAGVAVFIFWVNMDWNFARQGNPQGFNPNLFQDNLVRTSMTFVRIAGAAVIVPIMEELFWRSFLIRYTIDPDFLSVPVGKFTWPSFLITTLLFGLEHNLFLAGIMAGISYNLLLYYTKSISQCILAHAITNLALGLYVLSTGQWHFW
jgi:CAAX protease family protein